MRRTDLQLDGEGLRLEEGEMKGWEEKERKGNKLMGEKEMLYCIVGDKNMSEFILGIGGGFKSASSSILVEHYCAYSFASLPKLVLFPRWDNLLRCKPSIDKTDKYIPVIGRFRSGILAC